MHDFDKVAEYQPLCNLAQRIVIDIGCVSLYMYLAVSVMNWIIEQHTQKPYGILCVCHRAFLAF